MNNVIQFPRRKARVMDVTDWPIHHIRQYCKDNDWLKGFTMRRHGNDKMEIRELLS
jgi:hypothetical protein